MDYHDDILTDGVLNVFRIFATNDKDVRPTFFTQLQLTAVVFISFVLGTLWIHSRNCQRICDSRYFSYKSQICLSWGQFISYKLTWFRYFHFGAAIWSVICFLNVFSKLGSKHLHVFPPFQFWILDDPRLYVAKTNSTKKVKGCGNIITCVFCDSTQAMISLDQCIQTHRHFKHLSRQWFP